MHIKEVDIREGLTIKHAVLEGSASLAPRAYGGLVLVPATGLSVGDGTGVVDGEADASCAGDSVACGEADGWGDGVGTGELVFGVEGVGSSEGLAVGVSTGEAGGVAAGTDDSTRGGIGVGSAVGMGKGVCSST